MAPNFEPRVASPSAQSMASTIDRKPLLVEDESKFRIWLESYKGLHGLGFLDVISEMKSPNIIEDVCIQGIYQAASQMVDNPDPAPSVKISLDFCLGESSAHRENNAELVRQEGSTISQPKVFPSTGGMPGGFRLIQHDGQLSIVVRSAEDVYQFFFFKNSEQGLAIWYQLDTSLMLTRKGTFALTKASKAEGQ